MTRRRRWGSGEPLRSERSWGQRRAFFAERLATANRPEERIAVAADLLRATVAGVRDPAVAERVAARLVEWVQREVDQMEKEGRAR